MSTQRLVMALVATSAIGYAGSAVLANDALVIEQKARAFRPGEVTITHGDALTFNNRDEFLHQIYIKSDEMSFDSAEQSPGESISVRFPAPGTFAVRCHIHPKMLLTVHVK